MDRRLRAAGLLLLFLQLTLSGCGGGGGGGGANPSPVGSPTPAPTPTPTPPNVTATLTRLVLPATFDGTTFSLSKWPQFSSVNCTLYVADLHGTTTASVSVVVGGAVCPISEILNPGSTDARITFALPVRSSSGGAVPQGTHTVRVLDQGTEADQPSPPITITIAP